jgi:hypothetical protein
MLFDSFQFLVYQNGDDTINIQQLIDSDTLLAVPVEKAPNRIVATAYPNPFNQQIHITFQMPLPSLTSVTIYSINGSKVRTLISSKMMNTTNDIIWDGKNDQGAALSPGVYLYNISAGKLIGSGRIVMLGKE